MCSSGAGPALVRTAYLLCGDWHRAEDLVQQSLAKLYVAWPKVANRGGEDAYVRRILANSHLDDWRWRRRRPEYPVAEPWSAGQPPMADGPGDAHGDRERLRQALLALPQGQRRAVVLRYWLDLSIEQAAADLGVTSGTVKSQCARGLERLRALLADPSPTTDWTPSKQGARHE